MAVLRECLLSSYWGQINKYLPVMLLSLGKLEVEMPAEECAPGMSLTWSVLWLQSHRHDGNVFLQQGWFACGSGGASPRWGCSPGHNTSLVQGVDMLVSEVWDCCRDLLPFQLMSPVREKPDLCPSHITESCWVGPALC